MFSKVMKNSYLDPHPKGTGSFSAHLPFSHQVLLESIQSFSPNAAHKQTNPPTDLCEKAASLADVK